MNELDLVTMGAHSIKAIILKINAPSCVVRYGHANEPRHELKIGGICHEHKIRRRTGDALNGFDREGDFARRREIAS